LLGYEGSSKCGLPKLGSFVNFAPGVEVFWAGSFYMLKLGFISETVHVTHSHWAKDGSVNELNSSRKHPVHYIFFTDTIFPASKADNNNKETKTWINSCLFV